MIEVPALVETLSLIQAKSQYQLPLQLGGGIGGWSVSGQTMLRPASRPPRLPLFPWQIQKRSRNSVLLLLTHHRDEKWPWAFEARQQITVGEDSLAFDLSATNLGETSAPLAIGQHAHIPRIGARLTLYAEGVLRAEQDPSPARQVSPAGNLDFSKGAQIERADIDHCFCDWGRAAYVMWPEEPLVLEISASAELSCVVVRSVAGSEEFSLEPVVRAKFAMPVVAPGESFSASMRFRAIKR